MKNVFLTLTMFAAFAAGSVHAAPITTDVIYSGNSAVAAAIGAGNNDNVNGVNALTGSFAGDPWVLLDKSDGASNTFNGIDFVLSTAVSGPNAYNYTLSWSDVGGPGLPLTMDFVFVTKAGNKWAAYLFTGIDFTSNPLSGGGAFSIGYLNNGGQIPGLSHASIYGRLAENVVDVPEPSILFLLGMGVLGLGLMRRKPTIA